MRVGIVSLIHESNTFVPIPTTLDLFRRDGLLRGGEICERFADGHHEISGFLEGLASAGLEAVPIFYASTTPSGRIAGETCAELMRLMFAAVEEAGALHGYLVAPHGANAGKGAEYRDLDGYWLSHLRQRAGGGVPIVSTVDPHANLSAPMVAACDATLAYRTNPHLDQKVRGLEAADLMARTLRGEIRPVQAGAFPPVAMNIERQSTSAPPCLPLCELAEEILAAPEVLCATVALGFPYGDVEEMGSAFAVATDGEPLRARDLAQRLAAYLIEHRAEFVGEFIPIAAAVDRALAQDGPVCLLDMGDNVGGGSPGDGTLIARELHCRGGAASFVCLCDPQGVAGAREAGRGNRVRLAMGGKTDDMHGPPLQSEVRVRSLHEGKFREEEVRHGGMTAFDMGPTAVVETDTGLTISLTSRRVVPVSLGMMTSIGLHPDRFQVLTAKGVHAPVAAYAPVSKALIRVDTPGSTAADMRRFHYRYRRRPLYPMEEIG